MNEEPLAKLKHKKEVEGRSNDGWHQRNKETFQTSRVEVGKTKAQMSPARDIKETKKGS